MPAVALTCHPAAPCSCVRAVGVRVDRVSEQQLALRYRIEGDLERLQWPAPRPPAHTARLWQHTCFETFIKSGDTRSYLEFNFSPSSEWAVYGFDDYRYGMQPRVPRHPPAIVCRRGDAQWDIDVSLHLEGLLTEHVDGLRLGAAAVLEDRQGQLSYWALAHPSVRPDFHHADSFVLPLPLPRPGASA
jgi:hypothetical protein